MIPRQTIEDILDADQARITAGEPGILTPEGRTMFLKLLVLMLEMKISQITTKELIT